jgi:hypothetical protein
LASAASARRIRQLAGHGALEIGLLGCLARRFSQERRVPAERRPAFPGLDRTSGISKGRHPSPARLGGRDLGRAQRAPWLPAVPALVAAPKPMMVLQAMMVGLLLRVARPAPT